ncbi:uncharacterized protein DDB_G0284459-like isoform X1 [Euwallacea similis]|uniref:uncharacterized protein DDB_G0284459-like isoform X1 n=1 Tax=Euwallacea similis TaxID=1736056 RepID=UPI00344F85B2
MLKSLFPWKHNKTKQVMAAQPAMDGELIIQEQNLLPCHVCGRTFLANPLKKHVKVCEKNATKKRKPFDSLKQRVTGTDLADFHQKSYLKKREDSIAERNPRQSKWKEKHLELVTAIRAAKGVSTNIMPFSSTPKHRSTTSLISTYSQNERCPFCERHFGPKAFDRHVEWCKEKRARIQHCPANIQEAKERLEARIKYRVPPLNQSKRALVKKKYSNPHSPEPVRSTHSTSSLASPLLSRGPSIRKPRSTVSLEKHTPEPKEIAQKLDMSRCNGSKHSSPEKDKNNMCLSVGTPVIGSPSSNTESIKSNTSNYDPFEMAQRQFMELLECDDFKPFTPSNTTNTSRSHTTLPVTPLKTPTSPLPLKKSVKSADQIKRPKRKSVIDPPVNFKDSSFDIIDDSEFELIENIINEHFGSDEVTQEGTNNGFYLHNIKNNKESLGLGDILDNSRKYSDEMTSSIDPSLINEHDNLSIPEHLRLDDYSPTSTGTEITLQNEEDHYSLQCDAKIEPKAVKKPIIKRSLSLVNRAKRDTTLTTTKTPKSTSSNKKATNGANKNSKVSKNNVCSENFGNKIQKPKEKKGLPLLKRSVTLLDPTPKPSFKNKKELNDFFNGNEHKKVTSTSMTTSLTTSVEKTLSKPLSIPLNDTLKAEDLFAVDDEMYEEYKRYEEMYLKEKKQNSGGTNNNKKNKSKNVDMNYGLLTNSEEDDHMSNSNNKMSNDSAYGSLRKSSKNRIRIPKLAPLDQKNIESSSSSGSENGLHSPALQNDNNSSNMSKFCHECGTRFPVSSAKFCVECGVKRLVL